MVVDKRLALAVHGGLVIGAQRGALPAMCETAQKFSSLSAGLALLRLPEIKKQELQLTVVTKVNG